MKKSYRFISDPGHGWLEVPFKELEALGIQEIISGYSYLKDTEHSGRLVYLEEDLDAGTFYRAMKASGKEITVREVFTNHDSRVRNYNPYPESYKFRLWLDNGAYFAGPKGGPAGNYNCTHDAEVE